MFGFFTFPLSSRHFKTSSFVHIETRRDKPVKEKNTHEFKMTSEGKNVEKKLRLTSEVIFG